MNKYHNRKITKDGEVFDSAKEYRRWCELKALAKAGKIRNLQRQVRFELIPSQKVNGKVMERPCAYVADFTYFEGADMVVEDVKGYRKGTAYDVFVIKRKLMLMLYGIKIREV